MTRAFTQDEAQELIAYTNDPKIIHGAQKLAAALVGRVGVADGMAMLAIALSETFMAVLHAESPMPEINIKSIHDLIEALTLRVKDHEECAINRTAVLRGEEPDEEPPKPAVH